MMKPSSWNMQLGLASAGTYSSQSEQTNSPSETVTALGKEIWLAQIFALSQQNHSWERPH